MTPEAIETALGQQLEAGAIAPVSWGNKSFDGPRPYLIFEHLPTLSGDDTLAGGGEWAEGYVMIHALTDDDVFTTPGLVLAQAVRNRFPRVLRLPLDGGGTLVVVRHPRVLPAYNDGVAWRTPVRIDYRAG